MSKQNIIIMFPLKKSTEVKHESKSLIERGVLHYLNHQNICREYDVMHFIHDLSPYIALSKDEVLDEGSSFPTYQRGYA